MRRSKIFVCSKNILEVSFFFTPSHNLTQSGTFWSSFQPQTSWLIFYGFWVVINISDFIIPMPNRNGSRFSKLCHPLPVICSVIFFHLSRTSIQSVNCEHAGLFTLKLHHEIHHHVLQTRSRYTLSVFPAACQELLLLFDKQLSVINFKLVASYCASYWQIIEMN